MLPMPVVVKSCAPPKQFARRHGRCASCRRPHTQRRCCNKLEHGACSCSHCMPGWVVHAHHIRCRCTASKWPRNRRLAGLSCSLSCSGPHAHVRPAARSTPTQSEWRRRRQGRHTALSRSHARVNSLNKMWINSQVHYLSCSESPKGDEAAGRGTAIFLLPPESSGRATDSIASRMPVDAALR